MSMCIGLFTPGWPGKSTANGISTSVYHLAHGLKKVGHQPIILTLNIDGAVPSEIPCLEVSRRRKNLFQKVKAKLGDVDIDRSLFGESLADVMDEAKRLYGIDVVLVEETRGWVNAMIRRGTVPVVVFLHGPWIVHKSVQSTGTAIEDARREANEAAAFRTASALISPSRNVLDAVEAAVDVAHVPRTVIYNSYEPDRVFVNQSSKNSILFVGRFDRHKGGDVVIEAFQHLHLRVPDARLTFVGPDVGVHSQSGTLRIEDVLGALPESTRAAVSFLGRQTTDEIATLRRTHPIAVIASRYENLNYTMLEAMSAGQAIVSTCVGGPKEIFENGKTALLVPSEDPRSMAAALETLLQDPKKITKLGQAARDKVKADFSPESIALKTVNFIRDAI